MRLYILLHCIINASTHIVYHFYAGFFAYIRSFWPDSAGKDGLGTGFGNAACCIYSCTLGGVAGIKVVNNLDNCT